MKPTSLQDFYEQTLSVSPDGIAVQTGHFNVFRVKDLNKLKPADAAMFYNRKSFFKIALLVGSTKVKYADTTVDVEESGLLFADPSVPYQYIDQNLEDGGYFCIFSADFLFNKKSEILPDALPIFKTEYYPVFNISSKEKKELSLIFEKMCTEINSDYTYKYDLIRAYVAELIHYGQKLLPNISRSELRNAPQRITERFFSLLEHQFSINSPDDRVQVRTPKEYAAKLCVHVNYLNKNLKEMTGKSTSELLGERTAREGKILLKHSDWSIAQIAFSLGFDEVSHFSKFFKKHSGLTPISFRQI
nr:helix-turn-helix transcriptional regulator [uncultured Chryseobacterium sp.]